MSEVELDRTHHEAVGDIARIALESAGNPKERMIKDHVEENCRQRNDLAQKRMNGSDEPNTMVKFYERSMLPSCSKTTMMMNMNNMQLHDVWHVFFYLIIATRVQTSSIWFNGIRSDHTIYKSSKQRKTFLCSRHSHLTRSQKITPSTLNWDIRRYLPLIGSFSFQLKTFFLPLWLKIEKSKQKCIIHPLALFAKIYNVSTFLDVPYLRVYGEKFTTLKHIIPL